MGRVATGRVACGGGHKTGEKGGKKIRKRRKIKKRALVDFSGETRGKEEGDGIS